MVGSSSDMPSSRGRSQIPPDHCVLYIGTHPPHCSLGVADPACGRHEHRLSCGGSGACIFARARPMPYRVEENSMVEGTYVASPVRVRGTGKG